MRDTLGPYSLFVAVDGVVETVQDELLRVFPTPGASQDPALVRRERPPIWFACELRGACYQGMGQPSPFEAMLTPTHRSPIQSRRRKHSQL